MKQLPTLRRELIAPFAVFFAGVLSIGILSIILVIPRLPPTRLAWYVGLLLMIDVFVFALLAVALLRQKLFIPMEKMIAAVEDVSTGGASGQLPPGETREMARLSAAVGQMAERLMSEQDALAANI